ncbi:arginine--tRNA ligase [Nanobdella aerobiophila]|uniref:arginine--tRNA ligase n=1 Tax=Nanobdella aerobiophila TaxID=2586965 RepID=A0A915SF75_9ARCH|nr:arginine--tRNA ligase [Nanobdella aerobiophila]BBL45209.1 arginine--tRNA ligase [Nanobdella aerobiophila]
MWIIKELLKDYDIEYSYPPRGIDYDISLQLFKEFKKVDNKEKLLNDIIEKIKDYVLDYKLINGYLNIKLNKKKLLTRYNDLFKFEKNNKLIFLEHTSANPNKSLHIGHLRNSMLGDSLYKVFKLLNYNIIVLNYIDDTGAQVADNVLGIYLLKIPKDPKEFNLEIIINNIKEFLIKENLYIENIEEKIREIFLNRMKSLKELYGYEIPEKIDHYYGDFVYVIVNKLYDIIPGLEKYKYKIINDLENGNNEVSRLSEEISEKILIEQLNTLSKFDIYYDILIKESDIIKYELFKEALSILLDRGFAKKIRGTEGSLIVLDLTLWPDVERAYANSEKILIRADGTATYIAKDIAYALWKHGIINRNIKFKEKILQKNNSYILEIDDNGNININPADISINVIGAEQAHNQMMVKRVVESLDNNKKYIHYSYGLVMLNKNTAKIFGINDDKVKMSGRKGLYINVDDLYNKLYNIALEKFDKILAEKIIRSFISLEMLKYDKNTVINFDINKMLNLEEGNAIYFMYTYARINSLLNKAGNIDLNIDIGELNKYEEKLIIELFKFKDVLYEVENNLEINVLYKYLVELSREFNNFYQHVPILNNKDTYPHRIFLAYLTKIVMEKIFYVLKIDTVDKI